MERHLHIVSFDVPYPADYGGVIDVYYKVKALAKQGIDVMLHCYQYGRPQQKELEDLCEKVYYYPRLRGIFSALSHEPYIVYSRRSQLLLSHLLEYDAPILFEGLHTCHFLSHPALRNRLRIVRACNIEHEYYHYLAKGTRNLFKKFYFALESLRLRSFEKNLRYAHHILAITPRERDYFAHNYPEVEVQWVSGFHGDQEVKSLPGSGNYFLFHGQLSVLENELTAKRLIRLASQLPLPLVVAGRNPPPSLQKCVQKSENVRLEANVSGDRMERLIEQASAHILVTNQPTGLKLKLLNALYAGRYIIANEEMVYGTGLEESVYRVKSDEDILHQACAIASREFTLEEQEHRAKLLSPRYDDCYNAQMILDILSGSKAAGEASKRDV